MAWRSDGLLRTALESSLDCVKIIDLEGRLRYMNRMGCELMELEDFSAIEGKLWVDLWPAQGRSTVLKAIEGAMAGAPQRFQAQCRTMAGQLRWWDVIVSPLGGGDSPHEGLLATSRDITEAIDERAERAARELELARTAAALRSANRIAGVGGWEYEVPTDRVYFSQELRELLGSDAGHELRLEEAMTFWTLDWRAEFHDRLKRAIDGRERLDFEGEVDTRWGRKWLRVRGEPEIDAGACVYFRGAAQDVTAQKEQLQRIEESERQAQYAADAMSNFLATMSHEIRTPLNGVLAMAGSIGRGELSGPQREQLAVLEQSGEVLLSLLNDLLDLAKIADGKIELERGTIDAEVLAKEVNATFCALVKDKDVNLSVTADPSARGTWEADPKRLRQVLNNLVSNALKFTEKGEVRVTLEYDGTHLLITVSDTGIGIPADRLPHVFDRFVQADSSTTRRFGGSGLGLSICKELVELMGGEITASSVPGEGSTFTVRAPSKPVQAAAVEESPAAEQAAPAAALDNGAFRVLAAEDHATNQLVLRTLLGEVGIAPSIVSDGKAAVEAWRSGEWDVILMDIQMPVMDGVTAARLIREEELLRGRRRTPILALTANAMEHQKAEYLGAGIDGVVAKPINLAGLVESLQAVLSEPGEAQAA